MAQNPLQGFLGLLITEEANNLQHLFDLALASHTFPSAGAAGASAVASPEIPAARGAAPAWSGT
jgi:hypothetical protein